MRLLILGGSGFLGRHLTECALARGWEVTHFNRGQRSPGLYPDVTEIHGDRKKDLGRLAGLSFDTVVDTSGYIPRDAAASAEFLKPLAPHYVFVSSVSAFADQSIAISEKSALSPWDEALESQGTVEPETYGPLKAECERRVQAVYGKGALVIRPGLIVGRYDPTGRFSYWPQRFRKGGEIVVPEPLGANVQIIDAFDLANWTLDLCERRASGTLNAVGPAERLTFNDLVEALMPFAPPGTKIVPVDPTFLTEQGVAPWTGLPLWLPAEAEADGMMLVDLTLPIKEGLTFRPLRETAQDILAEIDETGEFAAGASLTEEQERELLAAWALA